MPPVSTEAGPIAPVLSALGGESPILIVDDSSVSRSLAGGLIRRGMNRPVCFAEGGREALDLLDRVEPAAVLTDLQMPGMDGLELVEILRGRRPRTPVILMTAHGSEAVALQALRAGAASYVPKRCLARDLVETLVQVLTLVEGDQRRHRLMARQEARSCRFAIENDPDLIAPLVAILKEDLATFGIGDETARVRVGVALQETLSNALFHGNLECSSDLRQEDERIFYGLAEQRRALEPYRSRRIFVEAEADRRQARYTVRDEGPGFDITSLDKPFDPEDLMRVGGRGMLLIRTFMDEVEHNATGNQITLVKRR